MTTLANKIEDLISNGEYNRASKIFLTETETQIEYKTPKPVFSPWDKNILVFKFEVILRRGGKWYKFPFYGSIYNYRKNKTTLEAYDILACLDACFYEDFVDFCNCYGYDIEDEKTKTTYRAVKKQDKQLRRLYNESELEALSRIA